MKVSVLIPAFNAASTLQVLLHKTLEYIPQENILVVDDGSFDATASISESLGICTFRHSKNLGKGAALQSGFAIAVNAGYDFVITMDADLQHQPKEIPNFIQRAKETGADIIIGTRQRALREMPIQRILSNTLTTFLVQARTGARVYDSQCGFRMISCNVLRDIQLHSSGYEAETELLIMAAQKGFRFDAIPIATIYAGERSYMTHVKTTLQFLKVLLREYH